MSDSRGGKEPRRIALAIGVLIAIAFGAGGTFWLGQYQANYLHVQEEGRRTRQKAPDSKCFSVLGITALCVDGENDAKAEAERAEEDLQAQQNMAEWAKWLTLLTAAQLAVGVGGVYLVLRGLDLNAEATSAATRQAVASEKTYIADNRPYFIVSDLQIGSLESELFDRDVPYVFRFRNYGKAPALVTGVAVWGVTVASLDRVIPMPTVPSVGHPDWPVPPGDWWGNLQLTFDHTLPIPPEIRDGIVAGEQWLHLFGILTYIAIGDHQNVFEYRFVHRYYHDQARFVPIEHPFAKYT